MTGDWRFRLYLLIPASAVTAQLRRAIAKRFADNGSGETEDNEYKLSPIRLSASGNTPATAYGLDTPAKPGMRDELRALIEAVPQARVFVLANTAFNGTADGVLIYTNVAAAQGRVGQVVSFGDILTAFNLRIIETQEA